MKKILINSLIMIFVIILGFSFKSGVAKKGHDKTGSPLSNGKCFNCHKAGKFGVSLEMKMFEDSTEVENYEPGHRYKLKFHIKHTGNPSKYGFQLTALNQDNKSAGKFENIPSGFALRKLKGVDYIDHTSPRSLEFLNVDWVAPDSNLGDVTVYFGGIAANGNEGTSGDGGAVNSFKIAEGASSSKDIEALSSGDLFVLNGNPAFGVIILDNLKYSDFTYRIISRDGRIIRKSKFENQKSNTAIINISNLNNGLYFIQVISGKEITSKSFVVLGK